MKRIITIAIVLAAALSSCTQVKQEQPASEIAFMVARRSALTKADYADYKDSYLNVPFGTYAWYKGVQEQDNGVYFANRQVGFDQAGGRWITVGRTYFWPGTGSLDFISYSPYSADGSNAPAPVITENGISYSTPWNVDANQTVDVMYADKATGLTGNRNTFNHGYEGVPTLFRHALSRIAFQLRAATTSIVTASGEITRWEIDVKRLSIDNLFSTGTVDLTLAEDGSWTKPESNVWTPTDATVRRTINLDGIRTLTEDVQSVGSFFALPQILDKQELLLTVDVRTYRDPRDGTGEKLIIEENDVLCRASLITEDIDRWGMNQYITYVLTIAPVVDIESSLILFDPAVADWDKKIAETEIVL